MRLLIVEDDEKTASAVALGLQGGGFSPPWPLPPIKAMPF